MTVAEAIAKRPNGFPLIAETKPLKRLPKSMAMPVSRLKRPRENVIAAQPQLHFHSL